jgi:hypothetical protein
MGVAPICPQTQSNNCSVPWQRSSLYSKPLLFVIPTGGMILRPTDEDENISVQ